MLSKINRGLVLIISSPSGAGKTTICKRLIQDIENLKKMGRPITDIKQMKEEESVVCSLTGSPSDYNMDY